MKLYEKIKLARELLDLPEKASVELINQKYKEALKKWHPDKCEEDKTLCEEKTKEIIAAYKVLMDYCNKYEIDFSDKEVEKYLSAEEFWAKKFAKDHLWGE